jgi:hypothetical protein
VALCTHSLGNDRPPVYRSLDGFKLCIAITLDSHILITMKTAVKKEAPVARRRSISKKEISERLADLDLAQTSAIRDLEMDINGEDGVDSEQVLVAARKALA